MTPGGQGQGRLPLPPKVYWRQLFFEVIRVTEEPSGRRRGFVSSEDSNRFIRRNQCPGEITAWGYLIDHAIGFAHLQFDLIGDTGCSIRRTQ